MHSLGEQYLDVEIGQLLKQIDYSFTTAGVCMSFGKFLELFALLKTERARGSGDMLDLVEVLDSEGADDQEVPVAALQQVASEDIEGVSGARCANNASGSIGSCPELHAHSSGGTACTHPDPQSPPGRPQQRTEGL